MKQSGGRNATLMLYLPSSMSLSSTFRLFAFFLSLPFHNPRAFLYHFAPSRPFRACPFLLTDGGLKEQLRGIFEITDACGGQFQQQTVTQKSAHQRCMCHARQFQNCFQVGYMSHNNACMIVTVTIVVIKNGSGIYLRTTDLFGSAQQN